MTGLLPKRPHTRLLTITAAVLCSTTLICTTLPAQAQQKCTRALTAKTGKNAKQIITPDEIKEVLTLVANFDRWTRANGSLSSIKITLSEKTKTVARSSDNKQILINPKLVLNSGFLTEIVDKDLLVSVILRELSSVYLKANLNQGIEMARTSGRLNEQDSEFFYGKKRQAILTSYSELFADLLPSLIFDRGDTLSKSLTRMSLDSDLYAGLYAKETQQMLNAERSFTSNQSSQNPSFWSAEMSRLKTMRGSWDPHLVTATVRPKIWNAIQKLKQQGQNDQQIQVRLMAFTQSLITRGTYDLGNTIGALTEDMYVERTVNAINSYLVL